MVAKLFTLEQLPSVVLVRVDVAIEENIVTIL